MIGHGTIQCCGSKAGIGIGHGTFMVIILRVADPKLGLGLGIVLI